MRILAIISTLINLVLYRGIKMSYHRLLNLFFFKKVINSRFHVVRRFSSLFLKTVFLKFFIDKCEYWQIFLQ